MTPLIKPGHSQELSNIQISNVKNVYFALLNYNNTNPELELYPLFLCKPYSQLRVQITNQMLKSLFHNITVNDLISINIHLLLLKILIVNIKFINSLYRLRINLNENITPITNDNTSNIAITIAISNTTATTIATNTITDATTVVTTPRSVIAFVNTPQT